MYSTYVDVPHNFPFRKDGMGINMENGNILCYVGSFVQLCSLSHKCSSISSN